MPIQQIYASLKLPVVDEELITTDLIAERTVFINNDTGKMIFRFNNNFYELGDGLIGTNASAPFVTGLKINTSLDRHITINKGKAAVYKLNIDGSFDYDLSKIYNLATNTTYAIINGLATGLKKIADGGIVADTITDESCYCVYVGVKSDNTNFVIVASSTDATAGTQILTQYPNCYACKIGYVFYDYTLIQLYRYSSNPDTKNCYFYEEFESSASVDAGSVADTAGPSETLPMPFLNISLLCKLRVPYPSSPFTRCYLQVTKPHNIKFDLTETGDNFLISDVRDELIVNSFPYPTETAPSFVLQKFVYGFINVV